MLGKRADTDALHKGDPVVAVVAMPDVPVGTPGTVKMVVGQAWTRYMVKWETGEWMGTVDGLKIVRADRVERYHARMAEEAERAALATVAPTEEVASSEGTKGDSRVPEHLLARSRSARERVAAAEEQAS